MKVLYINNYKTLSGWSQAGRDYILSLDSVGVDVVPSHIELGGPPAELPDKIKELERKSLQGCDYVIQHTLPHLMDYDGNFKKCVGLFASESQGIKHTGWLKFLNTMDESWVINSFMKKDLLSNDFRKPVQVIPHAVDISKFQKGYQPLDFLESMKNNGDFIFYTVGELITRKNYNLLLKAFWSEFRKEPVQLVIKSNHPIPKEDLNKIQQNMKLYNGNLDKFKAPIMIHGMMPEEDLMKLHYSCDCFVQTSFGEACSLPCLSAMAAGKAPIVPKSTGYTEYIDENVGWLVNCTPEIPFGATDTLNNIHTANETWFAPNIMDLRKAMREAFENRNLLEKKSQAGIDKSYNYTYEKIGLRMKDYLEQTTQKNMADLPGRGRSRTNRRKERTIST